MDSSGKTKKLTAQDIRLKKGHDKIVMATCYDYTFARLLDDKVDALLVGDSMGMVIQGRKSTLGVTTEDVIYHTQAVMRGSRLAHVIADMPFLSYQCSREDAVRNAGRMLAEGGAEAVKLEGGILMAETIRYLVGCGIPVMGHVGLTPQSVNAFGGFKVQGRTEDSAKRIFDDAVAVAEAGAYSVVLEGIPSGLAAEITARLNIPTIGIGAGIQCDGQVLVMQDMLGLNTDFQPRFVKRFANLSEQVSQAAALFAREVRSGEFPGKEHSF
jgi:3-methyl-2-oxobutanoate hydroxymethyltransferase